MTNCCLRKWGKIIFNVPGDPSRSGNRPVPVSGLVRLIIEVSIFATGAIALFASQYWRMALVFSAIILMHYILSYDRIVWLLTK